MMTATQKRLWLWVLIFATSGALPAWAKNWEYQGVTMMPGFGEHFGSQRACEKALQMQGEYGANTVAIRAYGLIKRFDTPSIRDAEDTRYEEVEQQFRLNRELGIKSVFTFGLGLEDHSVTPGKTARKEQTTSGENSKDPCAKNAWGAWHGTVHFDAPEKYDEFFDQYKKKLMRYAALAEKEKVQVFSIGNELDSLATTKPLKDEKEIKDFFFNIQIALLAGVKGEEDLAKHTAFTLQANAELYEKWAKRHNVQIDEDGRKFIKEIKDFSKNPVKVDAFMMLPGVKKGMLFLENFKRRYVLGLWNEMIHDVRQVYTGKLTYNANPDGATKVGFWKNLDFIGVNAYFGFREPEKGATRDQKKKEIQDTWNSLADGYFKPLSDANEGKKIVLTELGAPAKEYSAAFPQIYGGCIPIADPSSIYWKLYKKTGNRFFQAFAMEKIPSDSRKDTDDERSMLLNAFNNTVKNGKMKSVNGVIFWNTYIGKEGDAYSLEKVCVGTCTGSRRGEYQEEVRKLFDVNSEINADEIRKRCQKILKYQGDDKAHYSRSERKKD